jgi:isoamylase
MKRKILPGRPAPQGATYDGAGTNFALYSEHATRVEVCLFNGHGRAASEERITLPELTAHVWHGYIPDVEPGQLYGFRVHGPYEPDAGMRFNSNKLLIDPYARALHGAVDWSAPVFGYELGEDDRTFDERDSGWGVPKGVVVDPSFDWEGDAPPAVSWQNTIIYETHVKGITARHPDVPPELRGTYAGLASEPVTRYLKELGVTAVELLPVHSFLDDNYLLERDLRNYWGYNTINYLSPESRYASADDPGGVLREFKGMVKALHRAGLEVILDVVYNHTAEGNHLGPTLSLKGIDNAMYYRLLEQQPRFYMDYTGTGNSLNARSPQVLKLIMDSLRYWVLEMHVDGFRFDLASTLARELHEVDRLGSFFDIIHQDPVLSQVKLIAEPWDIGEGGYQVGNFPVLWTEWNGKYRDAIRSYWKGDPGTMGELGYRLTGSSDLYGDDGRHPHASINFITAHDGFTLHDLVSYNDKHNEANGERNRDGHDHNLSWNCGAEGPTDDPRIIELREQQKRNLIATLFVSQGVPMLLGGDEIGRTQGGNNNAYCQDNEISWHDWDIDHRRQALLDFTRRIIQLRKEHPALRRRKFFQGRKIHGSDVSDIAWFTPDGKEMEDEEWQAQWNRAIAMRLGGDALGEFGPDGEPVADDDLLVLFSSHHEPIPFTLPRASDRTGWELVVDTRIEDVGRPLAFAGGELYELAPRSLAFLRQVSR